MGSEKSNEVIANMFLEDLRKDGKDRYRSVIVNIVFTPLFVNKLLLIFAALTFSFKRF